MSETSRVPKTRRAQTAVLAICTLAALALTNAPALANTINVDAGAVELNGNGSCSLREAMVNANNDAATWGDCPAGSGADTIVLASGSTYTLPDAPPDFDERASNGLPPIASEMVIKGQGATVERDASLTCNLNGTDATGEFRIFIINDSAGDVTLENLTVKNGCADRTEQDGTLIGGSGGGLKINAGTATIQDTAFLNNQAVSLGGAIHQNSLGPVPTITNSTFSNNSSGDGGGAIDNDSEIAITGSSFSGNSTDDSGGAIENDGTLSVADSTFVGNSSSGFSGGAITNFWEATIVNSTFSGNSASGVGGAIDTENEGTFTNITVTNNSADGGGGGINVFGTLTIKNSIVANNSPDDCLDQGTINGEEENLDSDGTCPGFTIQNADPQLDTLADNGGPTKTHALQSGSPAVDAGTGCPPPDKDQRGVDRPQGSACDLGAFELEPQLSKGDPDDDGDVTAVDSRICLQIGLGFLTGSTDQLFACDTDGNAQVTESDAISVAETSIGNIEQTMPIGIVAALILLGIAVPRWGHRLRDRLRPFLTASLLAIMAVALTACPGLIPGLPSGTTGLEADVNADSGTITVSAQNMPNGGLASLGSEPGSAGLTFNAESIQVTGIEPASGWRILASRIDNTNGDLLFVAVNPSEGTTDGRILTIQFQPKSEFRGRDSVDVNWNKRHLTLGDARNIEITDFETETIP